MPISQERELSPTDADDERHQRRSTCRELARFSRIHDRPASGALVSRGATLGGRNLSCSKKLIADQGLTAGVGDEGGFAPNLGGNEAACELIVKAIERAGFVPGEQIAIALDPAASSFWSDGSYKLTKSAAALDERRSAVALLRLGQTVSDRLDRGWI